MSPKRIAELLAEIDESNIIDWAPLLEFQPHRVVEPKIFPATLKWIGTSGQRHPLSNADVSYWKGIGIK